MKGLNLVNILICLLLISCTRTTDNTAIPLVTVNQTIYVSDPLFFDLNPIGGWVYLNGGSRGILVYRNGEDDFQAYDRHCTYSVNDLCGRIEVDSSNILAIDTCCGSAFLLSDGSVTAGPAV